MNYIKISLIIVLNVITQICYGQSSMLYSARGSVKDEVTLQPLIGALVYVVNYENLSSITDEEGVFIIEGLPVGRHRLIVSYLGYVSHVSAIEIRSGKELIIHVAMRGDIKSLEEVVITAREDRSKPVNALSYASTRTFSIEESSKFAGAVDDPARMAQSFAGVVPTDDGSNYVSIRGNHPSGLLYRMEGVDIPNPNHFGDVASSGGGVSVLSSQVLANSDFSTGAFSAEYGNALGGIFDIKLRKGNNHKNEYTLKAGFLGMEAAIEGPFSKKYKGSYLVNYRYSTLSLINKLGVDLSGVLNYSDLSYNISLPFNKAGHLSLFGINGWSNQTIGETLEDIDAEKGASAHHSDGVFISNMSVNGAKYTVPINNVGILSVVIAYATTKSGFNEDVKTVYQDYTYFSKFQIDNMTGKISGALNYTQKISPKITFRCGVYYDKLSYHALYNDYKNDTDFDNLINNQDNTTFARTYGQMQYRVNKKWSFNAGLHYSNFLLNKKQVIEPRGNIQYTINEKSNVALAYGRHSQIQPLIVYFIKSEESRLVNKNLDFTKAHHIVLTHNYDINAHTKLKSELYYQSLSNIPVGLGEHRNYAITNQQYFFPDFQLSNQGKGRNIGIELTIERFLRDNWYFIITGSLFDSKYKTPATGWINTRYNAGYTSVITIGKEWVVGKSKRNSLGFNLKNALVGGQWDTPIDRTSSQLSGKEVRDESRPFSFKLRDFYKLDIGIRFKRNNDKYTSTLSLDLMNATNSKNIGGVTYDIQHDKLEQWTMMPFVPVLSYKVEF